ncbi:MAG TPA: ABC transporter permease [Candidatus Acidoferrales bacterium]|nr:ABC transporter permease [Candidatus Acidoferrales bacterium]HTS66395.1 ABC transporter permease [Candidatus Acidoferrales bacterium]
MFEDFRYAAGVLRRTPALTAVAVLTLALGIAATTTVFGWIDGMVLHPFRGARDDGQLAVLESAPASGIEDDNVSYQDCRDFQESMRSISALVLHQTAPASIGDGENAYSAWFELVSGNFFDVLGVKPVLGRTFTRDEYGDRAKAFTAVISYRLWKDYFGGDASVLGRTVRVNRHLVTIVGVAPAEFHGVMPGIAMNGWVPAPLAGERERDARHFKALVRLRPGVSVSEASAEARTVAARLARAFPKTNEGMGARIVPIWKAVSGASGILAWPMTVLGAACGLVLLIACANVTNLLLARSTARYREFGIRAALGAGPMRLSRQLICESLLLAVLATVAGLPLALWLQNVLIYFVPPTGLPVYLDVRPSARVFLFAALACLGSALISGLPPAWQSVRRSVVEALRQGGRGDTQSGHSRRISGLLVTAEVGLALAALVTLGLFVRSLYGLQSTPAGFDHRNVTVCRLFLVTNNYTPSEEKQFSQRLRERLLAAPGVTGAAYSDSIPLGFGLAKWTDVTVEGYAPKRGENLDVHHASVSPGYFDLLKVPFLAGRDFKPEDNEKSPRVMIVNESFARRFFAGRDPVGHRVKVYGKPFTIVGMVRDGKYLSLSEAPQPYFYMSFDQVHNGSGEGGVAFYARSGGDARGFVPVLRREMSAIDPNSAGLTAMPLTDYISAAWFGARIASVFLGVLGAISMLLAGVGLYGVMAYSVNQRTREIGIRMALGADREGVLRMVMQRGLMLALSGIAAGLAIALAASTEIAPLLYGVSPADPVSIAGAALFLLAVAVLASLIPALRATRVDPTVALRQE